ncbi:MAG: PaaI family thioesterase [Pseudomonadota bacterium]
MPIETIDGQQVNVGLVPMSEAATMSGLALMQAICVGDQPGPSIGAAMNFRMLEVKEGEVTFAGTPHDGVMNPIGTVHGGWASTILDSALACCVHTLCPVGYASTSIDLKVNFVRPILPTTGRLFAKGTVVHPGRQIATSQATLTDAEGKLYAHGTQACSIFKIPV